MGGVGACDCQLACRKKQEVVFLDRWANLTVEEPWAKVARLPFQSGLRFVGCDSLPGKCGVYR